MRHGVTHERLVWAAASQSPQWTVEDKSTLLFIRARCYYSSILIFYYVVMRFCVTSVENSFLAFD